MSIFGFNEKDAKRIDTTVRRSEGDPYGNRARRSKHKTRGGGGVGTATKWAELKTGSGLSYTADIYEEFASDMTFTAITPTETDVDVKVPDGCLDDSFDLTIGQVYPVAVYPVNGVDTYVIVQHVGIS